MSRIRDRFDALRASRRSALIPYIAAGDPSARVTVRLLHGLVDAGADLLELGVPFSDPMADGPVIQKAAERALAGGMTLAGVLDIVAQFRDRNDTTPVVLMGYLNPIEAMGCRRFAERASEAGVDGVLVVDLPLEEGEELFAELRERRLDPIFLVAPTTNAARIERICARASGYIYYVSLKGVTGSAAVDVAAVRERLGQIRALTDLPVGVGFGISDPPAARAVAEVADAVIVGTALVRRVEEQRGRPEAVVARVTELVRDMRAAMDGRPLGPTRAEHEQTRGRA